MPPVMNARLLNPDTGLFKINEDFTLNLTGAITWVSSDLESNGSVGITFNGYEKKEEEFPVASVFAADCTEDPSEVDTSTLTEEEQLLFAKKVFGEIEQHFGSEVLWPKIRSVKLTTGRQVFRLGGTFTDKHVGRRSFLHTRWTEKGRQYALVSLVTVNHDLWQGLQYRNMPDLHDSIKHP